MIEIKANIDWDQQQTDCRLCSKCESIIVTDMFVLTVKIEDKKIETQVTLCEPCFLNDNL